MSYRQNSHNKILQPFIWAFSGLRSAWHHEHHFRWHFAAAFGAFSLAGLAGPTPVQWAVLIFAVSSVIVAQLFNWCVELVCELVVGEYHPMVKYAKDAGAGAVLICAIVAVVVFIFILGPEMTNMYARVGKLWSSTPIIIAGWFLAFTCVCWFSFCSTRFGG